MFLISLIATMFGTALHCVHAIYGGGVAGFVPYENDDYGDKNKITVMVIEIAA